MCILIREHAIGPDILVKLQTSRLPIMDEMRRLLRLMKR